MANIFLFRHGKCVNYDSDSERLTQEGIGQAEKAGKIVGEIINNCYLQLNGTPNIGGLIGILKAHSGMSRTSNFLEIMYNVVEKSYKFGNFGLYGDLVEIKSHKIYRDSASEKIRQIITQCSPITGIQLIVGHNPGVARSVEEYVKEGFSYNGDERFLKGTLEGGGYYINTLEKTIQAINQ